MSGFKRRIIYSAYGLVNNPPLKPLHLVDKHYNYNNHCVVCATDLRLKQSIFCQACFTKQSANNKHCFHCGVEPTPMMKQPVYCEPKNVKPRAAPDLNQEDELIASGARGNRAYQRKQQAQNPAPPAVNQAQVAPCTEPCSKTE